MISYLVFGFLSRLFNWSLGQVGESKISKEEIALVVLRVVKGFEARVLVVIAVDKVKWFRILLLLLTDCCLTVDTKAADWGLVEPLASPLLVCWIHTLLDWDGRGVEKKFSMSSMIMGHNDQILTECRLFFAVNFLPRAFVGGQTVILISISQVYLLATEADSLLGL